MIMTYFKPTKLLNSEGWFHWFVYIHCGSLKTEKLKLEGTGSVLGISNSVCRFLTCENRLPLLHRLHKKHTISIRVMRYILSKNFRIIRISTGHRSMQMKRMKCKTQKWKNTNLKRTPLLLGILVKCEYLNQTYFWFVYKYFLGYGVVSRNCT